MKHIYRKIKLMLTIIIVMGIFIHSIHTISACDACYLSINETQNLTSDAQNATAMPVGNVGNPSYFMGGLLITGLLGVKIGVGSGLANLSIKEFIPVSIFYLIATAIIAYMSMGDINQYIMVKIINIAPGFYMVLALISIIAGVCTIKSMQKGNNISKKSFWILAAPCLLLVFSIMLISAQVPFELNNVLITVLITIGFVAIIAMSYLLSKIKSSPSHLGNLMIALGLGMAIVALMLPEYLEAGFNIAPTSGFMMGINEIVVMILFFVIFVALGFLKKNISIKRGEY